MYIIFRVKSKHQAQVRFKEDLSIASLVDGVIVICWSYIFKRRFCHLTTLIRTSFFEGAFSLQFFSQELKETIVFLRITHKMEPCSTKGASFNLTAYFTELTKFKRERLFLKCTNLQVPFFHKHRQQTKKDNHQDST